MSIKMIWKMLIIKKLQHVSNHVYAPDVYGKSLITGTHMATAWVMKILVVVQSNN